MKSTQKITLLLLLFISGLSVTVNAQEIRIDAEELTNKWTLFREKEGVKLSIQKGECKMGDVKTPFTYGFLKLENTSSEQKTVSFKINVYYTDGCAGCANTNEGWVTVTIDGNSTLSTDCSFDNGSLSVLIQNPLQSDFQDFSYLQLIDFKVN